MQPGFGEPFFLLILMQSIDKSSTLAGIPSSLQKDVVYYNQRIMNRRNYAHKQ